MSLSPEIADSVRHAIPDAKLGEALEVAAQGGKRCTVCGNAIGEDESARPSLIAYAAPYSFSLALAHQSCLASQLIHVATIDYHPDVALAIHRGSQWEARIRNSEPQAVLLMSPSEFLDPDRDLYALLMLEYGFEPAERPLDELAPPGVTGMRVRPTEAGFSLFAQDEEIFAFPAPDTGEWEDRASSQRRVAVLYGFLELDDVDPEELDERLQSRHVLTATVAYEPAEGLSR